MTKHDLTLTSEPTPLADAVRDAAKALEGLKRREDMRAAARRMLDVGMRPLEASSLMASDGLGSLPECARVAMAVHWGKE